MGRSPIGKVAMPISWRVARNRRRKQLIATYPDLLVTELEDMLDAEPPYADDDVPKRPRTRADRAKERAKTEEVRRRHRAMLDGLARVSDIGIGKGIDADGVFRKVRMRGIDERRVRLAVERAEKLGVAMRDFIAALPENLSLDDLRACLAARGLSAKKLIERDAAFRSKVEWLLPLLATAISEKGEAKSPTASA